MKEHSDLPDHNVVPQKAEARFLGSGETSYLGKYDNQRDIMSKSPKKKNRDQNIFKASQTVIIEDAQSTPMGQSLKKIAHQKIRDLIGTNNVNPATEDEIRAMRERYGSPEKQSRVDGYMRSDGVKNTLAYQDNDITYGLVNTKPNKVVLSRKDLDKETWKPKTTLRWHENPR